MIAFFTAGRAPASQRIAVSAALTLMASTGGPLSAATLGKDGTFSYNVASVPLLAEAVKLLVSVICLKLADSCEGDTRCSPFSDKSTGGDSVDSESFTCSGDGGKPHDGSTAIRNKLREDLRQTTWRSALVYFPPSMLFIVINNLRIWNMRYIDPASAELLGTLRIALTAVMLRCFLRRSFTRTQWASVALLYFSVGLSQMDGASLKHIGDPRGYLGVALVACCSASASVYMEWALKGSLATSIHSQNALIYGWGVLLNGSMYLATSARSIRPDPRSFIDGYTSLTWLLVAHLACSGLIVAWLLKYSDSITKIQATSASLFLTAIVSAAWLGTVISVNMIVGMIFVAFSMFMYHGLFPNAA